MGRFPERVAVARPSPRERGANGFVSLFPGHRGSGYEASGAGDTQNGPAGEAEPLCRRAAEAQRAVALGAALALGPGLGAALAAATVSV